MKNDKDISKYLGGNPEAATDHISTQVHINKKENKRLYNKYHICYYCGECIIKITQHLLTVHSNEPEVEKIENMEKDSQERNIACRLL